MQTQTSVILIMVFENVISKLFEVGKKIRA